MITDPLANLGVAARYTRERYGVSDEALEYRRRRGPDKVIEPTERDWAEYRAALAVLAKADSNPHIFVGPIEIEEPAPHREPGDYIESEREWIERVVDLIGRNGGELPPDLDRALSSGEFKILNLVFNGYSRGDA